MQFSFFCHHYQTHDRFHSHLSTLIQPEQLSILSPHKCERICDNSSLRFSDVEILLKKSHLLPRPILSSYVEQVWRPHPHPAMVKRSAPTKQMFFIWPKPKNPKLHIKMPYNTKLSSYDICYFHFWTWKLLRNPKSYPPAAWLAHCTMLPLSTRMLR